MSCLLSAGAVFLILALLLGISSAGWIFVVVSIDSLLIGDLLDYFRDRLKTRILNLRLSLFFFILLTLPVVAFGEFVGQWLEPLLNGPFPSLAIGDAIVLEFMGLTTFLLMADILLKNREFVPQRRRKVPQTHDVRDSQQQVPEKGPPGVSDLTPGASQGP